MDITSSRVFLCLCPRRHRYSVRYNLRNCTQVVYDAAAKNTLTESKSRLLFLLLSFLFSSVNHALILLYENQFGRLTLLLVSFCLSLRRLAKAAAGNASFKASAWYLQKHCKVSQRSRRLWVFRLCQAFHARHSVSLTGDSS